MANMRRLSWVVDRLPGVRPRLASVAIKNGLVPGVMDDIHFLHGERGPAFLMGYDAARLVLDAYRAGVLPMEPRVTPVDAPEIDGYLLNRDGLQTEAEAHRRSREGVDPFQDWRAMEELFRRDGHPVPVEMRVGDILVTRHTRAGGRDPAPDVILFGWSDASGSWLLHNRHGRRSND